MRAVMQTLDDWLAHCERLHPKHIELGLERVRAVAERMALRFDCPVSGEATVDLELRLMVFPPRAP